jgi:hypothetical protein
MPSQVPRHVYTDYTAYLIPGPHPLSGMNVYYDRDVVSGLESVALCSECWQMYIDASSGSLSHVKGKLPCLECLGPPAISVKHIYKSSELAHVVLSNIDQVLPGNQLREFMPMNQASSTQTLLATVWHGCRAVQASASSIYKIYALGI